MLYWRMKKLGLPSYLSQFLVKPISFLVLSPEYTFQVALALADIYFTTNVAFDFKRFSLKIVVDEAIWLLCLVSAMSNL
jgi:hypothetical protein